MASDIAGAILQPHQRVLQVAMADRRGSNDQRAVGNRFRHGLINFRACQRGRRAHRRSRILKRYVIRIYQAKARKSKIAHRTRSRTDVQRIAHVHQNDAEVIRVSRRRQVNYFTAAMLRAGWNAPRTAAAAALR